MEAHANVRDMGLIDAKMAYIKAWQALPEFGITYFIIRMQNCKKEVRFYMVTALLQLGYAGIVCLGEHIVTPGGGHRFNPYQSVKEVQNCANKFP